MPELGLGREAYERKYARSYEVELINRFFEQSPTNRINGAALLSRPATSYAVGVATGPIRRLYAVDGAFDYDLFIVSDDTLYRWDGDNAPIAITGTVLGTPARPEMQIVTGPGYEYLFIADGTNLQYYPGPTYATGTLTLTPASPPDISNQVVRVGSVYYQWASPLVGAPDGTVANPYQVAVGADDEASLDNFARALNASGSAGSDYSSSLVTPNPDARATANNATTVSVRAANRGVGGNTTETQIISGSALAWSATTLAGGGVEELTLVPPPDSSVTFVSIAQLAGFLIAVQSNSQRWYFLRPGEVTFDPLDFFSAEQEPDQINTVRAVGDTVMFFGTSSTETWYATGDTAGAAFLPVQGRTFSFGSLQGTAVAIKDQIVWVGSDDNVYLMAGQPQVISNPGISERIREARKAQS